MKSNIAASINNPIVKYSNPNKRLFKGYPNVQINAIKKAQKSCSFFLEYFFNEWDFQYNI